jgi:hypothetical protein
MSKFYRKELKDNVISRKMLSEAIRDLREYKKEESISDRQFEFLLSILVSSWAGSYVESRVNPVLDSCFDKLDKVLDQVPV